ncbi:MAG TPA: hypothetical protein VLV83_16120 [Acidobacteriota bacterium]|nr:hypothetical protein [Acidobacteriota bacterium]
MKKIHSTPKWISALQFASLGGIWIFVLGISYWILGLIRIARQWHDVPSASLAISIVAIPVFWVGAGVLTYVFFGLRGGRYPDSRPGPKEGASEDQDG